MSSDDPPVLTALSAGHVTITAGDASADVTVSAGALPLGTVIWSNPGNGSGVYSIVPAVPSASGVADVFAFQGDGTVQAITSDGATAWTADVSQAWPVVPDFQGGLVGIDWSTGTASIVKWDGTTGQRYPAYIPSGDSVVTYPLGIHPDGTVFAIQRNSGSGPDTVIGVDPTAGTQKFSVPLNIPSDSEGPYESGIMIAGDGHAYVPYGYRGQGVTTLSHLRLLRIDSAGAYDDIPIADITTMYSEIFSIPVNMITNADTGILLSWSAWNGYNPVLGMAITNGTGVSLINGSLVPDQSDALSRCCRPRTVRWTEVWAERMIQFSYGRLRTNRQLAMERTQRAAPHRHRRWKARLCSA